MYVESSPKGHELYQRFGFQDLELKETDLSKWGATQPHRCWAMITSVAANMPSREAAVNADSVVGATTVADTAQ